MVRLSQGRPGPARWGARTVWAVPEDNKRIKTTKHLRRSYHPLTHLLHVSDRHPPVPCAPVSDTVPTGGYGRDRAGSGAEQEALGRQRVGVPLSEVAVGEAVRSCFDRGC